MSIYLDRAKELRGIVTPHYNCAQSVLLPFAEGAGLTKEQAFQVSANFGAGMKVAGTCGAITGGLMVLGLYGVEDGATVGAYFKALRENHQGFTDCANLLRLNKEQGGEKKPHCDAMVYECVELVENILRKKGKI
jgi:C_GCAxxG_C_C family probable redox protein